MTRTKVTSELWALIKRKQFDVIGLTEEQGWTNEKIHEFTNEEGWFQRHTWNSDQKYEWIRYLKRELKLTDRDIAIIDLDIGWTDEKH